MTIESVMNSYRSEKVPDIIKDYRQVQQKLGVKSSTSSNEQDAPWWSGDLGEEIKDKDYICAKALTSMAILNGPTDVDDLHSAWKQIKSGFKNKMPDGYDPKVAQHPFSFFRGTVLHEYLNPNSEKCINKDWAKYVIKNDVSLADTKFGDWVREKLGFEEDYDQQIKTNINDLTHTENKPNKVVAKAFKSKNTFGDLTARALTRTSKYGAYALGGLGALHAAHEIADGENPIKELAKTALQVGTTLAGVGYLGAIGYKHFGALGSLLGMGLGTAIGAGVPKLLFEHSSEII